MKKTVLIMISFCWSLNSQWIGQVTPNDVNMLLSIDFMNIQSGVAGGWKTGFIGRAVYTTNSGINWLLAQVPDSSRSLVKVQMINASTGYCAGAYNILNPAECKTANLQANAVFSKHFAYAVRDNVIGLSGESESYKGIFLKTTNGGQSWNTYGDLPSNVFYLLGMHFINEMTGFVSSSFQYSGGISEGVLKTTNGGISWNTLVTIDSVSLNSIFTFNGNNIYVAGRARTQSFNDSYGIILRSTNGGISWNRQNINYAAYFQDVFFIDQTTGFIAGGTELEPLFSDSIPRGIMYKTTNNGANWLKLSPQLDSTFYYATGFIEGKGIAVGEKLRTETWHMYISRTTDYGNSWSHYIGNDTNLLWGLKLLDTNVWFVCGGVYRKLIYKTTNGGEIGLEPIECSLPQEFNLLQNYPNPFNPVTKIKFALPPSPKGEGRDAHTVRQGARVVVYDILGREVATLVNEQLQPGTYEVEWDATSFPSGVYYYRLFIENYSDTKKMVLIK